MNDDPAAARAALVEALELVLPGRVFADPPSSRRLATPAIWVEQPNIGPGVGVIVARFPIWIVVDGAIEAQSAAMLDLCWNAWLAVAPLGEDLALRPTALAGFRAAVLEVDVPVAAVTMCYPPAPQTVTFPPVTTGG